MWKAASFFIIAFFCATAHPSHGPLAHAPDEIAQPRAVAPLWVGPAYSGTWYTPERSGEGFTLQILDTGAALAMWFTYPPAGSSAQQAWIYAADGAIEGDRLLFDTAFTTRGPRFGAGYDASRLQPIAWGTLRFRFFDCNNGEVTYDGPPGWGSGTHRLTRLTAFIELECGGKRKVGAQGARTIEGLRQRSGLWFDPSHNGEGWVVEELPDGRAQFFWFTYDENGEQAWTLGVSQISGNRIDVTDNYRPVGTRFGADFDPAKVVRAPWGRVSVDFAGCHAGVLRYESSQPAFGSATLRPVRASGLAGIACLESPPSVPAGGTWSAGATMPLPQSELATASMSGMSYVAGGFGEAQGFKRYDPAADSWKILADIPGGRDHAMATVIAGNIHVAGGFARGEGDTQAAGWRYSAALDRWETIAELPRAAASGAATLDGFAYFADDSGTVYQFNDRMRKTRTIAGDGSAPRDHSQLVAFQGELWLMGGRNPSGETRRVSIYDPASETWRAGPSINVPRGGFAAAATDRIIVIAGGEVQNPRRALSSVEAIAAGDNGWTALTDLPIAVHGVGGAIHGNAFFALGGSKLPGGILNGGEVQIYRWGP